MTASTRSDVAALDLRVEVLQEADALVVLAVARELDEVERVVDRDRAREVADERDARLQRADEQRLAARVVAGDLGADLAHAGADLVGVEEDLADAVVVVSRPARSGCLLEPEAGREPLEVALVEELDAEPRDRAAGSFRSLRFFRVTSDCFITVTSR